MGRHRPQSVVATSIARVPRSTYGCPILRRRRRVGDGSRRPSNVNRLKSTPESLSHRFGIVNRLSPSVPHPCFARMGHPLPTLASQESGTHCPPWLRKNRAPAARATDSGQACSDTDTRKCHSVDERVCLPSRSCRISSARLAASCSASFLLGPQAPGKRSPSRTTQTSKHLL